MKQAKQRRAPSERPQRFPEAALALFVEKGFAGTRLDDVAERAGLSKAAIYLYFKDKEARLEGVIRQTISANIGTVETLARAHQGKVSALIPAILEFMASRVEDSPMPSIAKLVIAESRAFPEMGR